MIIFPIDYLIHIFDETFFCQVLRMKDFGFGDTHKTFAELKLIILEKLKLSFLFPEKNVEKCVRWVPSYTNCPQGKGRIEREISLNVCHISQRIIKSFCPPAYTFCDVGRKGQTAPVSRGGARRKNYLLYSFRLPWPIIQRSISWLDAEKNHRPLSVCLCLSAFCGLKYNHIGVV